MADHKKEKVRFTTKIVVSAVLMTTLYTVACFFLAIYNIQNKTSVNLPAELTALYFAFWTVEIIMLATLDKAKIKNKYLKEDEEESENKKEGIFNAKISK